MCAKEGKTGRVVGGIILGALMGAVAGVLFAPTSGKETRKKIKKMVDSNGEFLKEAKEKTEETLSKTMDAIKHGMDKIGKIVEEKRHPDRKGTSNDQDDNSEAAA